MKEIKLTIDGKEVKLTDKQLKVLGIEIEGKRKNPFERVGKVEPYYYIDALDCIQTAADNREEDDNTSFEISNYFNDKSTAQQVMLHQLLYRKLLKFAYNNGIEDTAEWDGRNPHWVIRYNEENDTFALHWQNIYKSQEVYFSSEEDAKCAIEEVVKPFIKEHPEFVW